LLGREPGARGCSGARLINLWRQDMNMYEMAEVPIARAYPDLWRPGRYRVELRATLYCDPAEAESCLERLDYEAIDADQWGRSYRDRRDDRRTAELDESGDEYGTVRLVLRQADVDPAEADGALEILQRVYAALQRPNPDEAEAGFWDIFLGGRAFSPLPRYAARDLDGEAVTAAYYC